jgi:hypothetical protein
MKKKSTDKKLKLVQQNVRALTVPELARVDGGGVLCQCSNSALKVKEKTRG